MDEFNRRDNDNIEDAPNHGGPTNEGPIAPGNFEKPETIATYSDRDEETAAELTADDYERQPVRVDEEEGVEANTAMGWIAIALSIVSFFWLPIILGAAGVIVGFMARARNADTLGNIAIVAGAISIVFALFIGPFL
ncbi:hypothetical protein GMD78_01660 [Ornithinibacillus sp. L9]|uniref:DUF4190 domain-containing protein n=1 Tax=Ornithinibacillus caprae TaxID=2678566 RepID=A0A6N8FC30_9BACI|nr:hypothetical protein [Ornithinibacillus caprae]MUK87110.1 hypothetical protein [Ornithinibacillus caprae]